ncbi:TPA: hypothetical protein ACH3X3_004496 [Trebouxia sp. C0006]
MRILVGIDLVGKEDMLVAIASVTGEKVGIDHNRLMTVVAAGFDARHFTLDLASGSACLHTSAPADLDRPSFQAGSSAASRQTRQLPHSLQKTQTNQVPAPGVALPCQACVASKVSSASDAPWQAPIGPKPPEDSLQYFANFVCSHDAKGFRAALNR